jgi:hypothetical protein
MNTYRKTAIAVGVLFLIALILNLIGMSIYDPILSQPDYLAGAYPARIRVVAGVLIDFLSFPAIVLIPVVLFPILKRQNMIIATAYVGFRFLEAVFHISPGIRNLTIIDLSREYLNSGASDNAIHQTIGALIHAQNNWTTLIYILIFTMGAVLFYWLLIKSNLVPRIISVWGLIAAVILMAGSLLGMFGIIPTNKVMMFFGPLVALNELTLSIWLIAKGFNPQVIAAEKK